MYKIYLNRKCERKLIYDYILYKEEETLIDPVDIGVRKQQYQCCLCL